jgi:methionine biosynthesis protein MetW
LKLRSSRNCKNTYELDLFKNSSHARIFDLIQSNSRVLDVGCATGYLGEKLIKEKNCEVTGIELNKDWALEARTKYKKVYIEDVESTCNQINEQEGYFDYILYGDVLEHTKNPEKVLTKLNVFASDNGTILISLPNVANIFMRLNLLVGRFEYAEKGTLDRTHLRFYTRKTGKKMIESTGVRVIKVIPIGKIVNYIRIMPTLFAYQFLFVCRKQSQPR